MDGDAEIVTLDKELFTDVTSGEAYEADLVCRVKAEYLRLLMTLKLNPAKSRLINGFVESYLKLSLEESRQLMQEVAHFAPEVKEKAIEVMLMGQAELTIAQVRKKFQTASTETAERIKRLNAEQLQEFGLALFDFETETEPDTWLSRALPH